MHGIELNEMECTGGGERDRYLKECCTEGDHIIGARYDRRCAALPRWEELLYWTKSLGIKFVHCSHRYIRTSIKYHRHQTTATASEPSIDGTSPLSLLSLPRAPIPCPGNLPEAERLFPTWASLLFLFWPVPPARKEKRISDTAASSTPLPPPPPSRTTAAEAMAREPGYTIAQEQGAAKHEIAGGGSVWCAERYWVIAWLVFVPIWREGLLGIYYITWRRLCWWKLELLGFARHIYTIIQGKPAVIIQRAQGKVGIIQKESYISSKEPRKVNWRTIVFPFFLHQVTPRMGTYTHSRKQTIVAC